MVSIPTRGNELFNIFIFLTLVTRQSTKKYSYKDISKWQISQKRLYLFVYRSKKHPIYITCLSCKDMSLPYKLYFPKMTPKTSGCTGIPLVVVQWAAGGRKQYTITNFYPISYFIYVSNDLIFM